MEVPSQHHKNKETDSNLLFNALLPAFRIRKRLTFAIRKTALAGTALQRTPISVCAANCRRTKCCVEATALILGQAAHVADRTERLPATLYRPDEIVLRARLFHASNSDGKLAQFVVID
jgi:hypothetical protein